MIIYKITNNVNGKVYIGQTIGTAKARFHRHIQDAISGRLKTHFANAIRKYSPESFSIEVIDIAETQEELTQKEHYWINYFNSVKDGYNETDSILKCGGNTYLSKTEKEMELIKDKIRGTKIGGKNPMSRKVKCRNEKTGEEHHFESFAECQKFFNHSNHNFITRKCRNEIKCLFKGEWNIAYEEDDYNNKATPQKNNRRSKKIKAFDLTNNDGNTFHSYAAAERYFGLKPRTFSSKAYKRGDEFVVLNRYKINILYDD